VPARRIGREQALQALYSIAIGSRDPGDALSEIGVDGENAGHRIFVRELVMGTLDFRDRADVIVRPLLEGWALERLPAIDRLLIQMGTYELACRSDIPTAVAINEAVELAKRFSTEDSGRFVNGVLNAVARLRETGVDAETP
jgi:transcription antitermination protein NusB